MKPRRYRHRIAIFENTSEAATDDGFGGNIGGESQLGSSWCNIRTITAEKLIDYGLDQTKKAIIISLRKRVDIDLNRSDIFFKYGGEEFYPSSVTEDNLNGYHFTIIAQN